MKETRDIMISAASDVFTSIARQVVQKRRLTNRVGIIEATGRHTIRNAKEVISVGAKVLIARERSVWPLEGNMPVSVADVPHLYGEIYESIQIDDCAPEETALIGFDSAYDIMLRFRQTSGIDVQVIDPKSPDTVKQGIISELHPGARLLISGFSIKQAADVHELRRVMLRVHLGDVGTAIDRALNILMSMEAKNEYLQTILATTNGTPDVILNCSPTGELLFLNDNAEALLRNWSSEEILHLPSPEKEADWALNQKELIQGSTINLFSRMYLVSYRPIVVNAQLKSVVITVGSGNRIQSVERQIRMKLSEKYSTARCASLDIVGESAPIKEMIRLGKKYTTSNSAILTSGETGMGKETFAQNIHNASSRTNEPFVAISYAAPPGSTPENELFGYVGGTLTGANKEGKMGLFELVHGGAVSLDKIGEMNIDVQAELLRVLRREEISRLDDNKIVPIDVRAISATNKNLGELVQERKLCEGLLYHLNILELCLPPLRERKEDISCPIEHYTRKNHPEITFSKETVMSLQEGAYPGNIRQFLNLLERAITLPENTCIGSDCLEGVIRCRPTAVSDTRVAVASPSPRESIMGYEREKIQELLARSGGNWAQATVELDIGTTTLRRKMRKHRLIPWLPVAANQNAL